MPCFQTPKGDAWVYITAAPAPANANGLLYDRAPRPAPSSPAMSSSLFSTPRTLLLQSVWTRLAGALLLSALLGSGVFLALQPVAV